MLSAGLCSCCSTFTFPLQRPSNPRRSTYMDENILFRAFVCYVRYTIQMPQAARQCKVTVHTVRTCSCSSPGPSSLDTHSPALKADRKSFALSGMKVTSGSHSMRAWRASMLAYRAKLSSPSIWTLSCAKLNETEISNIIDAVEVSVPATAAILHAVRPRLKRASCLSDGCIREKSQSQQPDLIRCPIVSCLQNSSA